MKFRARRTPVLSLGGVFAVALLLALPYYLLGPHSQVALASAAGSTSFTWSDPYRLVQHPIPEGGANPWAITTDSQGNVWFVEQGTDQLGMYDPQTRAFTQYDITSPHSTPDSVAVDATGDVWFSELTSGNIGELPRGETHVVEHHVPPAMVTLVGTKEPVDCGPGAVLPDTSGSIWIACLFSDQIDEYFPSNQTFARFDLPVFDSAPAGVALDGRGDLWFTAANANMLGRAVISELRNGTTDGIKEFPPLNSTYQFKFYHATSFLNTSTTITTSLPTPSGIAIDGSGRLWITEHVDSSFDTFDPGTGSLVRYWTSQTNGAYGYPVSFPNGVVVGADGTVWVGEHYGNKIAEFDPSAGLLTEYPVPCCGTTVAGVYSIALDRNGTLWFVEIGGDSIGEVVRTPDPYRLSLTLPDASFSLGPGETMTIPLGYSSPQQQGGVVLNLAASGISVTGALQNMTANFTPARISLPVGGTGSANLTLALSGLSHGVYYLTLTAGASPRGVLYSAILKLTVSGGGLIPVTLALPAAAILAAAAVYFSWRVARGSRRRSCAGAFLRSLRSANSSPAPTAASPA